MLGCKMYQYIIACCALHNICILQGDVIDIEPSDIPDENADIHEGVNIDEDRQRRELGMIQRKRLCANLNNWIFVFFICLM